jgi:HK97 family phage major capsid protein
VFSVIGRVPTSMGSVEYYYWYPDPEAMASEVPEGELKPEAQLSGEMRAAPVSTYAWWKGITRQALDDIPMIRGVVDTMLRRGVIRRINAEAATALTTDTNIPTLGDGAALLSVIRFAIAQVDEAGYSSNAVLLNPFDWAAFDVQIQQLLGTTGDINRVFWGLTPVSVPGLPSGTCYVGDMREGVTFFDRQATTLLMTDSHGEYFLRNKLVLLAEARGKVAVTNAASLVKCTGEVPETPEGLSAQLAAGATAHGAVGERRRAVPRAGQPAAPRPPASAG